MNGGADRPPRVSRPPWRRAVSPRPALPSSRADRSPRGRGALATLAAFVVEPVEPVASAEPAVPVAAPAAVPAAAWHTVEAGAAVVAVVGLAPGCGATTVARAVAAELARRRGGSACVLGGAFAELAGGVALGTPAAARLSRTLGTAFGVRARALGRICLVPCELDEAAGLADRLRPVAPLVLDVGDPSGAGVAAAVADAVVLVAAPSGEPALADLVAASLERVGPAPVVALNERVRQRAADPARWRARCALTLPSSRLGARLALGGREPRGELGAEVGRLVDLIAARDS